MSENEETKPQTSIVDLWLEVMDLDIGQEVMVVPVAGQGGGFQGTLVDVVVSDSGPEMLIIEKLGSPRVSLNWANCVMVTRVVGPSSTTVTPADLVKMADENGMDVPDSVRAAIADLDED
jgi:hypothetical protein